MSRLELIRVRPERRPTLLDRVRSYWSGPLTSRSPELARWFGGAPTTTGISVNEQNAMSFSAVWSAVTMISDDIASLPLHLYKRLPEGGKDRFEAHPLYRLLHDAPNPEMDTMVFRRTLQAHALLWQNAYAEIERDGAGRPIAMWPLVPESVQLYRNGRALTYRVTNPSGSTVDIQPQDMIHLVGHSHDGSVGSSLVQQARESLSLGLAAERFGGAFFGNGATFGGVISFKGPKPAGMAEESHRKQLEARHVGVERAHKMLALYNDATFTQTGVEPDSAQFLETRVFQVREVARWFKIPPHKLADLADATFSNVEQQNLDYYSSCLRPWLVLWEQQLTRKLVAKLEQRQQLIEHDTHGFLSADAAGRAALYAAEFRIGSVTPNEIRGYENRDPLAGGHRSFIPLDMIPMDRVDEWIDAQIEAKKPPKETPPPVAPAMADPEDMADRAALRAAVAALEAAREAEAVEKRQALQRAEDLSAALAHEQEQREAAEANYTHTVELLDGATSALAASEAERIRQVAEAHAEKQAAIDERDAAIAQHGVVVEEAAKGLASLTQQREEAKRLAIGFESDLRAEVEARAHDKIEAIKAVTTLTEERDVERAKATVAETQAREAEEARAHAERDKAAIQQAKDASDFAREALETELTQTRANHAARVNGVLVAHRGLIVDVMRRMVEREIDRAKRHQTTPQKFRAWVDAFYQTHAEAVAEALLPAVRAHLSILSSTCDPHELARQLAEDHVAESAKQLRDLLHVEDFAPMLERTLAQWETSRPEIVADRLLTKGLADVR